MVDFQAEQISCVEKHHAALKLQGSNEDNASKRPTYGVQGRVLSATRAVRKHMYISACAARNFGTRSVVHMYVSGKGNKVGKTLYVEAERTTARPTKAISTYQPVHLPYTIVGVKQKKRFTWTP